MFLRSALKAVGGARRTVGGPAGHHGLLRWSGGQVVRRSGGQVAHEALELHVALGEPDVARGNVRALGVRVALGDT